MILKKNKKQIRKKINIITKAGSSIKNKTGPWRTKKPITDFNTCIGCGLCAKLCPEGAITMVPDPKFPGKLIPKVDYNYCKGCALCAHECPVKAIKMKNDY